MFDQSVQYDFISNESQAPKNLQANVDMVSLYGRQQFAGLSGLKGHKKKLKKTRKSYLFWVDNFFVYEQVFM